jgi:hypothetical protein
MYKGQLSHRDSQVRKKEKYLPVHRKGVLPFRVDPVKASSSFDPHNPHGGVKGHLHEEGVVGRREEGGVEGLQLGLSDVEKGAYVAKAGQSKGQVGPDSSQLTNYLLYRQLIRNCKNMCINN